MVPGLKKKGLPSRSEGEAGDPVQLRETLLSGHGIN
jgi:hypothetical protein